MARAKTWAEGRGKKTDREKTEERVREMVKPVALRGTVDSWKDISEEHSARAVRTTARISKNDTGPKIEPDKETGHFRVSPGSGMIRYSPALHAAIEKHGVKASVGQRLNTIVYGQAGAQTVHGLMEKEFSSATHDRAAKDHESAAKSHVISAGGIMERHGRDVAAALSEDAHESGEGPAHFRAMVAHAQLAEHHQKIADSAKAAHAGYEDGLKTLREKDPDPPPGAEVRMMNGRDSAKERHEEHQKMADDHRARAEDHEALASSRGGDLDKISMISAEPLAGADAKVGHDMLKRIDEHVAAAVDHKLQASAHRAESKKDAPAMGGAWDDTHPRDEHGRFTSK